MKYTYTWTQPYYGWQEWKAKELEEKLKSSGLLEAKAVIEKIMKL